MGNAGVIQGLSTQDGRNSALAQCGRKPIPCGDIGQCSTYTIRLTESRGCRHLLVFAISRLFKVSKIFFYAHLVQAGGPGHLCVSSVCPQASCAAVTRIPSRLLRAWAPLSTNSCLIFPTLSSFFCVFSLRRLRLTKFGGYRAMFIFLFSIRYRYRRDLRLSRVDTYEPDIRCLVHGKSCFTLVRIKN